MNSDEEARLFGELGKMLFKREKPSLLSVVVPIYNEEKVIPRLKEALDGAKVSFGCPVEIIHVDDDIQDPVELIPK